MKLPEILNLKALNKYNAELEPGTCYLITSSKIVKTENTEFRQKTSVMANTMDELVKIIKNAVERGEPVKACKIKCGSLEVGRIK